MFPSFVPYSLHFVFIIVSFRIVCRYTQRRAFTLLLSPLPSHLPPFLTLFTLYLHLLTVFTHTLSFLHAQSVFFHNVPCAASRTLSSCAPRVRRRTQPAQMRPRSGLPMHPCQS